MKRVLESTSSSQLHFVAPRKSSRNLRRRILKETLRDCSKPATASFRTTNRLPSLEVERSETRTLLFACKSEKVALFPNSRKGRQSVRRNLGQSRRPFLHNENNSKSRLRLPLSPIHLFTVLFTQFHRYFKMVNKMVNDLSSSGLKATNHLLSTVRHICFQLEGHF